MNHKAMTKFVMTFVTASILAIPVFAQESAKILITQNCASYNEPNPDSQKVAYIKKDEVFTVVEETDEYYGIQLEDNSLVYIRKRYTEIIAEKEEGKENQKQEQDSETQNSQDEKPSCKEDLGIQICNFAKQYVGTPYASGGTNLSTGVDCSGFTQTVYKQFGIQLQRRSRDQYSSNGVKISKEELKPGDLVFYYSPVSHVAIYIGDGKVVHASTSSRGVVIDPISMRGMVPVGYKRVI